MKHIRQVKAPSDLRHSFFIWERLAVIDTRQPDQADTGEYTRVTWSCPVRSNMQHNLFQWLSSRIKFKRTFIVCDVCIMCNAVIINAAMVASVRGMSRCWLWRRQMKPVTGCTDIRQWLANIWCLRLWGTSCARQLCGARLPEPRADCKYNPVTSCLAWPGCTARPALHTGHSDSG